MSADNALAAIRRAATRREAVRVYLDIAARHSARIAGTVHRAEQIYRFETPERPWFQWNVTGLQYERSAWVNAEYDGLLDSNLQGLVFKLETMPESDYVPLLHPGIGTSDLIPRMFGVTFDKTPEGAVLQRFNLIEELPRDLVKLRDVNYRQSEAWSDLMARVRFLVEVTEGQAAIALPQMQGPDTNIPRLMDQAEFLMACRTEPDSIRFLGNLWAEIACDIILEMQRIAGDADLVRPRQRFYQPTWIKGLVVGDYLPLMQEDLFFSLFAEAFDIMRQRVGPLFYHTCGPVSHTLKTLRNLPGLDALEFGFARGQAKTTADIEMVKEAMHGDAVICSFELPLGQIVDDEENLTAVWLRRMSEGGGFMLHHTGALEQGRALFRRLELV